MTPLLDEVPPLLRTQRFGRPMQGHETVTSTNTLAWMWAAEGAPEGAVVLAEHQSAGRGRLGRVWADQRGLNLLCSVVLHPTLPPTDLGLVTLAAGVAVAEALDAFTQPVTPSIKWPNDVLLEGRKCGGILLESALQPGRTTLILGIGLNVNQTAFPPDLSDRATSLLLTTGRHVARAPLLAALLERLEARYDALQEGRADAVRTAYLERLAGLGEAVTFRFAEQTAVVHGTVEGITETGALRLRTPNGVQTFLAGEITSNLRA